VRCAAAWIALGGVLAACGPVRGQDSPTLTDRYDFSRRTARFDLPGRLDEVSGLAMTPDGRLFAHGDERATVYEIDPSTGEVGKRFHLDDPAVRDDFEGMAIVGERFFLISSLGLLYEFREVGDRERAPYRVTDTRVGAKCEVEGLDHDPVDDVLLVACKRATPEQGAIVIYRLPLDAARGTLPPIVIDREQLRAFDLKTDFAASGVAVDPTETIVLVSGRDEAIIEVDRSGRVLAAQRLSRKRHPQSEGIEYGPDGTLYVADERGSKRARLTAYARRGAGAYVP